MGAGTRVVLIKTLGLRAFLSLQLHCVHWQQSPRARRLAAFTTRGCRASIPTPG